MYTKALAFLIGKPPEAPNWFRRNGVTELANQFLASNASVCRFQNTLPWISLVPLFRPILMTEPPLTPNSTPGFDCTLNSEIPSSGIRAAAVPEMAACPSDDSP